MIDTDKWLSILDDIAPTKRKSQRDMLKLLLATMENSWQTAIKAPTGTGKSLANLLAAAATNGTTLISTGTLGLQTQYQINDIPFVVDALRRHGIDFKVTVLRGRRNYGCRLAADEFLSGNNDDVSMDIIDEVRMGAKWIEETVDGDFTRAPFDLSFRAKDELSVDGESCVGKRCRFYDSCHFEKTKERAAASDAVLVNHALLVVHAATGGKILPGYTNVIIDEAHKLESFAIEGFSNALSFGLSRGGHPTGLLPDIAKLLGRVEGDPLEAHEISERLEYASKRLHPLVEIKAPDKGTVGFPSPLDDPKIGPLLEKVAALSETLNSYLSKNEPDDWTSDGAALAWKKAAAKTDKLLDFLAALKIDSPGFVTFISSNGKKDGARRVAMEATDVDVGKYMRPFLWTYVASPTPHGVAFTSATIPATFAYRMGLRSPTGEMPEEISLPSPFDLPNKMLVYVADDLPPATFKHRQEWEPHAIQRAIELTDTALNVGGVLVLCSSLAQSRLFASSLSHLVTKHRDVLFLVDDGETDKNVILDKLQNARKPFFIGSRGFYEGLDLKGKLRLVIIPSLPFAVPMDPVGQARRSLYPSDAWNHPIDLAETTNATEQMIGRLIRSTDDCGLIAILDQRILHSQDSGVLQQAIPKDVQIVGYQSGADVLNWLKELPEISRDVR